MRHDKPIECARCLDQGWIHYWRNWREDWQLDRYHQEIPIAIPCVCRFGNIRLERCEPYKSMDVRDLERVKAQRYPAIRQMDEYQRLIMEWLNTEATPEDAATLDRLASVARVAEPARRWSEPEEFATQQGNAFIDQE